MNFNDTPLLVIWETTQACDLACIHCRASAMPERHRGELTTPESYNLLDQVRSCGNPLMIFTGGACRSAAWRDRIPPRQEKRGAAVEIRQGIPPMLPAEIGRKPQGQTVAEVGGKMWSVFGRGRGGAERRMTALATRQIILDNKVLNCYIKCKTDSMPAVNPLLTAMRRAGPEIPSSGPPCS